ncbi:MAG: ATP-binding protein [Cyanobacteria bacterium P01_F01_bin.150]
MVQQSIFTNRTLQLLDGLGLEEQLVIPWFDSAIDGSAFEPSFESKSVVGSNLLCYQPVAGDRPFQRSYFPVHESVSDAVFRQVFNRSPDAMTLSTIEEGRFIAANHRFLELSGYTQEEVIGSTSIDLKLWPEPLERSYLQEKLKRQKALYNEEGGLITKSGQYKTVRVSAEIIPVDNVPYVLCSIRDITQEKKAEDDLKLVNERDRLLGKIALNIRQSLDLQQILQTTVTEVRKFLGVERVFVIRFDDQKMGQIEAESVLQPFPSLTGEIIGPAIYDEISEIYQDRPILVINNMDDIQKPSNFYLLAQRYQVKAGLGVPIQVNGELFGFLVAHQCENPRPWTEFEQQLLFRLSTQVTIAIQQSELFSEVQYLNAHLEQQVDQRTQELAQRTKELEQRTLELEDLGQFRDFLLHAVTHDLRTSAVGMTMLLQSLDCQASESSVRLPRGLLDNMIRACNKQRDKLDAIQEVHRLKLQGLPLQSTAIAIHTLVDHVIEPLEARINQSQATIENTLSAEMPKIQGDIIQLEQVFQHLITNAIDHNLPGVNICISGQVEPCGQSSRASFVRFQVSDDGKGIGPEKRNRLFHLCADCPEARQYGGIRLGLYLCRQIVHAHGGQIGVNSVVGEGTTVWFKLPIHNLKD